MRISAGLLLAASSAAAAAVVAPRHDASAAAAAAADVATPVVRRTQSGKGITLPIYSRKQADRTPSRVLEEARRQRQRIQNRYGSKQTSSPSASDSASKAEEKRGTVGIVDFGPDSFYFAQIAIGTPPQLLDISLDTGSSDFWVADSQCTSAACQGAIPFDEGASSSLVRSNTPWSIQYGKGSAAGLLAADTVSFAGYTVMNSTFALATEVDEVLNAPISGLMGLAWKSLSTTGATPFWQAVVEGGTVQDQVFSFQLARNNEAENLYTEEIPLNPGGVFTLGEIDENQFQGQITWHTVPDRYIQRAGYWAIELESVSVQGRSATTSGQYAVIDTGTTLIAGPPNLIAAFYDLIPNSQPIDGGFYVFPCDTTVELSFTFDGTTYDVDPRDFNFGAVGQGYCVGSLFEENLGSSAPQFIVGDTFLKNVYSAYRYNPPSVGFAKLKNGAAQVLSIPSGASKTASAIATASRSSTGATPTTVPGLVTQSTRVNSSPTGLSGGSGLPDPSVVSGTSPVTSLSFSTLPSSGAGSSGGGGSSAAAPSLVRAGGLLAAGSGALVAAFMAGAAVLLL